MPAIRLAFLTALIGAPAIAGCNTAMRHCTYVDPYGTPRHGGMCAMTECANVHDIFSIVTFDNGASLSMSFAAEGRTVSPPTVNGVPAEVVHWRAQDGATQIDGMTVVTVEGETFVITTCGADCYGVDAEQWVERLRN